MMLRGLIIMALSSLDFFFREAAVNIRRHGLMSLAAIGTITFALFIVGGCGVTMLNLHHLAQDYGEEFALYVWLYPQDSLQHAKALREQILSLPGVKSANIITRGQTYDEFKQHYGNHPGFKDFPNPFGHAIQVEPVNPQRLPGLSRRIATLAGVDKVKFGDEGTTRMLQLIRLINWIMIIAGGVLAIGVTAITHNTVRLTLFARRREIGIMQVVGATNWFVSGPFLIEGAFHGLIGATLGTGLLMLAYHFGRDWLSQHLKFLLPVLSEQELLIPMLILIGVGMLLGLTGSAFSIRRFLRHGVATQ